MKTLVSTLLILLCLAACGVPFFDNRVMSPTAIKVKLAVDSMAGSYIIVMLEVDGKDLIDSVMKYSNIDGNRCVFTDYRTNAWADHNNQNLTPNSYRISNNSNNEKALNDTLYSRIVIGGSYSFKNDNRLDSLSIGYSSFLYSKKIEYLQDSSQTFDSTGKHILPKVHFKSKGNLYVSFKPRFLKVLESCKRILKNDSLILENSSIHSKMILLKAEY